MQTEDESADSVLEPTFVGKLTGVVENHEQLRLVSDALAEIDVRDIIVLSGPAGIQQLEVWQETVSHFFLSDMEGRMVERYLQAVSNGNLVFAAVVESEHADAAGTAAKATGALEITHFGQSVTTGY